MEATGDIRSALQEMDGFELHNHKLHVSVQTPKNSGKVGNK